MTMPKEKREIQKQDIMSLDIYIKNRKEIRKNILSFKKDLLLCSKPIFRDVCSKNEIDLRCKLNSSKLSLEIDSCALIPSFAIYILPRTSSESHLTNN